MGQRTFGSIRKLASGNYQARYFAPTGVSVSAPTTFQARIDAEAWLAAERKHFESPESYLEPKARLTAERARLEAEATPLFADYAERHVANRTKGHGGPPIAPSTKRFYRALLEHHINPALGQVQLDKITPAVVLGWHDYMRATASDKVRREAYSLGKSILTAATRADGVMPGAVNPFNLDAGRGTPRKRAALCTSADLEIILATIRHDLRAAVMLALGCGMRFSEIQALRRSDIDLHGSVVRIRRAVSRGDDGALYEKEPKSAAGIRDQRIPEAVLKVLVEHLQTYVTGPNGLVFTGAAGGYLRKSRFDGKASSSGPRLGWYAARRAAGRDDLHFHDLRATGATLIAQQGASTAEVQVFLGDSSAKAAEHYVRAAQSRMTSLTTGLSDRLVSGDW